MHTSGKSGLRKGYCRNIRAVTVRGYSHHASPTSLVGIPGKEVLTVGQWNAWETGNMQELCLVGSALTLLAVWISSLHTRRLDCCRTDISESNAMPEHTKGLRAEHGEVWIADRFGLGYVNYTMGQINRQTNAKPPNLFVIASIHYSVFQCSCFQLPQTRRLEKLQY